MSDHVSSQFGRLLRHHRGLNRLSQEQLAERAGLSVRAISDLERGVNRLPRRATADLLVDALQLQDSARGSFLAVAAGTEQGPADVEGGADRGRSPLPVPVTSLIGREADIPALDALLANPDVRLVTLTGPGGVGKTRLAIEAARRAEPMFADGVAYVPLAAVRDPQLVMGDVARSVGMRDASEPVDQRLFAFLADSRLLLLLDNFEHVTDAAPGVAAMLSACPGVKILVTSRSTLRLSAERRFPVATLATPSTEDDADLESLIASSPAVRMFVERARDTDPAWMPDDVGALAELCRRLSGLPLAIELAAARCAVLSVSSMLRYGILSLLEDGGVDAPSRHRSLRTTLAWSHGLLDPAAERLLRRLSVFSGGATEAAIEAVCETDSEGLLGPLSSLVEASLVRLEPAVGEARYSMLDTVHEFARERLESAEELAATRARHADYFLDLAEGAETELAGPAQAGWLRRIEADLDNLRACLDLGSEPADRSTAVRIAAALWRFWETRGYVGIGLGCLEQLLADRTDLPPSLSAKALNAAGILARDQNDLAAATRWHQESEAAAREAGEPRSVARALNNLGNVLCDRGQYEAALAQHEESLRLCRQLPEDPLLAVILINTGISLGCLGYRRRAVQSLVEAARLCDANRDTALEAAALSNLARVVSLGGHLAFGRRFEERALRLRAEVGDTRGLIYSVEMMAWLAAAEGRVEQAVRLLGAAESLRERLEEPPKPMHRELNWTTMRVAAERLGERRLATVLASGRLLSPEQAVALAGLHPLPEAPRRTAVMTGSPSRP